MCRLGLPLLVLVVIHAPVVASAVDYSKIDRTLVKEPAYAHAPEYALLLFGREARFKVWMVADGNAVYLDRNGDGDLTGEGERFVDLKACANVELLDPDGRTRYRITSIGAYTDDGRYYPDMSDDGDTDAKRPPKEWMVAVDILGAVEYQQYCDVAASASASEAKLAHFSMDPCRLVQQRFRGRSRPIWR
jgi:hypothetical protein